MESTGLQTSKPDDFIGLLSRNSSTDIKLTGSASDDPYTIKE